MQHRVYRAKCETLTIWNSIWLTCGTVWSKASSTTQSTSGVHDFVPVSVRKRDISNGLWNLRLNFVINWHFVCHFWSWMYCFNVKMSFFVTTVISQGSVATDLKCDSATITLLQIYCQIQQWKKFENRLMFARVMDRNTEVPFFDSQCIYNKPLISW